MTAAALSVMLVLALAGCTTSDAVEPTPTPGFASEEEAFAAAEETYRAYVDAVNARREDPAAENPQHFLIGSALEADIDTQRLLDESDVRIVGPNTLTTFEGLSSAEDMMNVTAVACVDASTSQVVNEQGQNVTPADRDTSVALDVTFLLVDGELMISESTVSQDRTC